LRLATLASLRDLPLLGIRTRLLLCLPALALLLLVAGMVSANLGPVDISVDRVLSILAGRLGLDLVGFTRTEQLVVEQIRLPRIVVGSLVGMALATAGASMQGLFRNPMADPGIIGVSAGGATGAVLAIALGLHGSSFALPVFAFLGALGASFLVYGIATAGGRFSMAALLLAGVAVASFLGAVISAVLVMVPEQEGLREILFWLAGGLEARSWAHVRVALPMILLGTGVILLLARDLNLLLLGDDEARSLGVRVAMTRNTLLAAASMVTGVAVAVSGTIGFVGLVVPHMLRLVVGPDHRVLIPASALGGALFLVLADTVARTVLQPAELRVGIVTAFVGAPFFVFLLIRNKGQADAF
jgi:iron complex transport system permease protein